MQSEDTTNYDIIGPKLAETSISIIYTVAQIASYTINPLAGLGLEIVGIASSIRGFYCDEQVKC